MHPLGQSTRARADGNGDAVGGRYNKNIILDHVSASWSTDEVLSIYHCEYVTIQNCIISESVGDGESHKFAAIWGSNYSTHHHNLIAHCDSRNPRWASGCGYNDYRNNVIYNWGYNTSYGGEAHQRGDRRNPPIASAGAAKCRRWKDLGLNNPVVVGVGYPR